MTFTEDQLERYARHVILKEVGGSGQQRLLRSRVLVIGAGGLGSPLLLYLAAAGVGTLGVVDDDVVTLSNLQRQIAHTTERIGVAKPESAALAVRSINPDVAVLQHPVRLKPDNALSLIGAYDLIADGSDNFATRFLVNDACYFLQKPLVSAAILRFDGQLSTFKAHLGPPHPCYRCLYTAPPPPELMPSCAEGGVLGALAGMMGSLQAIEVLKELLGIGESLSGRLLIYEALTTRLRLVALKRDPRCPLCGLEPSIRDLSLHAA